jgi:hypothetical protein
VLAADAGSDLLIVDYDLFFCPNYIFVKLRCLRFRAGIVHSAVINKHTNKDKLAMACGVLIFDKYHTRCLKQGLLLLIVLCNSMLHFWKITFRGKQNTVIAQYNNGDRSTTDPTIFLPQTRKG